MKTLEKKEIEAWREAQDYFLDLFRERVGDKGNAAVQVDMLSTGIPPIEREPYEFVSFRVLISAKKVDFDNTGFCETIYSLECLEALKGRVNEFIDKLYPLNKQENGN